MAIVLPITGDPQTTEPGGGIPPGLSHSCINYVGYDNVLARYDSIFVPFSDGEARDCLDFRPFTRWAPANPGPSRQFQVNFAEPVTIDYLALYDFELANSTLRLQFWNGSAFQDVITVDGAVVDGRPLFRIFAPVTAQQWRIMLFNASGISGATHITAVSAGQWLGIPMQEIGWTPPRTARKTEVLSNLTDSGQYIGRSVLRSASEFDITATFLQIDWAYAEWLAFMKHAEKLPFFFHWDVGIASDTAFCWTRDEIPSPTFSGPYNVDARISVRGVVDAP